MSTHRKRMFYVRIHYTILSENFQIVNITKPFDFIRN